MTLGESPVQGFLLSFPDSTVLRYLDWLEDYKPHRPAVENEYIRQQIETYSLAFASLGLAWVYLMSPERVRSYRGILLPNGWWSGAA